MTPAETSYLWAKRLAGLFPELPDTAAEAMDGELPVRQLSANWAAGPTLTELWQAQEQHETDRSADAYWDVWARA